MNVFGELFGLLGYGWWGGDMNAEDDRSQAMEAMSFSRLSRPLDEVIEIWSSSMLGSVWGIPTLNAEDFNLLTLP